MIDRSESARHHQKAADANRRRLFVYNGGFLTQRRVRRILDLAGYDVALGAPGPEDLVGVWGQSPTAPRGTAMARHLGRDLLRIEDPFLRSVKLGRQGAEPLGLLIDSAGLHFDPAKPSDLENILAYSPLDDSALLARARDGIARLKAGHLSKYNLFDPALPAPEPGYVLLIDQSRGDASISASGASLGTFREMLFIAREEHPKARILIRSHPETAAALRQGHFDPSLFGADVSFCADDLSPWTLLEGAIAVYTVSSQFGFEAILAGHRPRVFGQPFYAGWGLSDDQNPLPRRRRKLTRNQLFVAAMILYPIWYDPCRDRLCSFEEALDQLEAEVRAYREDRAGHVAFGMRAWKHGAIQEFFGRERPVRFAKTAEGARRLAKTEGRCLLVWSRADEPPPPDARRVEDGFLRSRGLGAALVPPLSLVSDPDGIYFDPRRPSGLDRLIAAGPPPGGLARAERLIERIRRAGLSKYNLGLTTPPLPDGHRILVPGQVEDDASIRLGAGEVRTNLQLLQRVRAENPDAVILYKPHPDVEAGLRPGHLDAADCQGLADMVLTNADPAALLDQVQEVWTITSTLGFEALLRELPVTCLGQPFYAGWGLTRDLGGAPPHRSARPTLAALAHAVLISYPRYHDPVSRRPCPPEVALERLISGAGLSGPRRLKLLGKLQGLFAGQAALWRRSP
ncbi:MAG: capsular polysaccharide biosynthesis protein [Paracoccaceae bacterium]